MKSANHHSRRCHSSRLFRYLTILVALLVIPSLEATAANLTAARVSQVIRDVKILPEHAPARPAKVSDSVHNGSAVRTGTESRAELTFTDQTLARLGANTIFSFNEGTRNLDLSGGAMLLRVPKNSGGAQVTTSAITAAITGTTIMLEYHPNAYIKFIVLEGTGRIFRNNRVGESVLVHAGQMLIVNPNGKGLPDPVDVDLGRLTKTSLLIIGFPPLPSLDLIAREIGSQDERKNEGGLIQTNLVIFGGGTAVSLLDPTAATTVDQANSNAPRQAIISPTVTPTATPTPTATMTPTPTITPAPTPSKFGTPSVISSPVPYVISSGTTIQTDPAITTNGKTDFGKIYRGPTLDGPPSAYLFTATSSFDIALGFDQHFEDINLLPLAVFKFSALQITGDPTISIPEGGATNLALISVGDITSGAPGGSLTFTGLDSLLLATQNGSITLTSDLSFENIPALAIYARGLGSTLTLDAAISGTTDLFLGAEGNVVANGALTITQTNNGLSLGLFAIVIAGGDITVGNGLSIVNDNSVTGNLLAGGSITLSSGGDLTVNGDGNLTLTIDNSNDSHIGSGGDIFVTTGGNLAAGPVTLLIDNSNGGSIDAGGGIFANIGGSLTTTGDASFVIGNNDGGTMAGGTNLILSATGLTIGGEGDFILDNSAFTNDDFQVGGDIALGATISLSAANISTGGGLFTFLYNDGGGQIGGDALIIAAGSGGVTSQGDLFFDIQNSADTNNAGVTLPGGTIGGNASVLVSFAGDIVSQGVGEFAVLNNYMRFLDLGGTISGDATVLLSAGGISTGGFFQPLINNDNGSIGGGASLSVAATGDISVGAETFFNILNSNGSIGGDATSDLTAANFTSGSTFNFQILNDGGSIGGIATLDAILTGSLTSTGAATIQITNGAGSITNDATINFAAASFTAPSLLLQIDNTGGVIGGTSNINFVTIGDMTINGGALTATFANVGSSVGAGGDLSVVTGGMLTAGSITGLIDNSLGGSLVNGGNIFVSTGGDLVTTSGGAAFTINNTTGNIDTGGNITFTTEGSVSTSEAFSLFVDNYDFSGSTPGHIGTGGNISVTTGGDFSAQSVIALINNRSGGRIDSPVSLTLSIGGVLTTSGESIDPFEVPESLSVEFSTRFDNTNGNPALASTVGGDATLTVNADSASIGGRLSTLISNSGSTLSGSALVSLGITHDMSCQGEADMQILNDADIVGSFGGMLHGSATLQFSSNNFTANALFAGIDNRDGAGIDSNAALTFDLTGSFAIPGTNPGDPDFDSTVPGEADLFVENQKRATSMDSATSGGTIGENALIQLSSSSASTAGALDVEIQNFGTSSGSTGGNIGGNATISLNIVGGLTTQGDACFDIGNQKNGGTNGGMIGGDATISVTAANVTANSLTAMIDNTGGSIGGNAAINMNVSSTVTVSNDTNLNILGSDGAAAAAINFNGGSYDVGGTFLSTIDGDGAITFSTASVNADVLKVGVFGNNGTLTIGGGTLSGNTELKLYAPGSNGSIDFVANATLNSQSTAAIIAANTVTLENGVVVTIAGSGGPAQVFANIPNYTGSGGNGSTTGLFGGNGATTQPLANAPPFDNPSNMPATRSTTSAATIAPIPTTKPDVPGDRGIGTDGILARGKQHVAIVRVTDSNDLLDLAERVTSTAKNRSNAPTGRTAREAGGVLSGRGRLLSPIGNVAPADRRLTRTIDRQPASVP